jgi:hypothetical protein
MIAKSHSVLQIEIMENIEKLPLTLPHLEGFKGILVCKPVVLKTMDENFPDCLFFHVMTSVCGFRLDLNARHRKISGVRELTWTAVFNRIFRAFSFSSSLRVLQLCNIRWSGEVADELAKMLRSNQSLEVLQILSASRTEALIKTSTTPSWWNGILDSAILHPRLHTIELMQR